MNIRFHLPGILLSVAFLVTISFFVKKSYHASQKFRSEKSKVIDILNFKDRLLSARSWLFTEEDWEERKAVFETTIAAAEAHKAEAKAQGMVIIYASIMYFIAVVGFYFKRRIYYGLTLGVSVVSIAMLAQGVVNPIMEMAAYQEDLPLKLYVKADDIPFYDDATAFLGEVAEYVGWVDASIEFVRVIPNSDGIVDSARDIVGGYEELIVEGQEYLVEHQDSHVGVEKVFKGKTYYYYQNKGIMEVITMLWISNNRGVSVAIGLFSVIIPLFKLISSLVLLFSRTTRAKRLRKVLAFLSKWSMADVFVVSLFLAYLSFSNMSPGVTMDAQVLFGLYYFLTYVLLSITLGFCLDASVRERERQLADEVMASQRDE
jgi:hypothetical protein